MSVKGSSPLTRGKRKRRKGPRNPQRLIPAHAGKTGASVRSLTLLAAHPRSRGENLSKTGASEKVMGSSPLTRGKRAGRARPCVARGLIPAHAGKTLALRTSDHARWAHPRSRGENVG